MNIYTYMYKITHINLLFFDKLEQIYSVLFYFWDFV